MLCVNPNPSILCRHASNVDDPYLRTKWNKCKKDLMEEFNMVKQIDAERQAFREAPGTNSDNLVELNNVEEE